jgi:hypothetical protein
MVSPHRRVVVVELTAPNCDGEYEVWFYRNESQKVVVSITTLELQMLVRAGKNALAARDYLAEMPGRVDVFQAIADSETT